MVALVAGLSRIYLYEEPRCPALRVDLIAAYLRGCLRERVAVATRGDFWAAIPADQEPEVAAAWAQARISDPGRPFSVRKPLAQELRYERRRLRDLGYRGWGILYDGLAVMRLAASLLPAEERVWDYLHIIFTNQLLGTWDREGSRWHARTAVFGFPCLVSTSGLAVAPARSPAWHLLKQVLGSDPAARGFSVEESFLEVDDPRLTEVGKGIALQCVFYRLMGDPFCGDPACRLYNAHRQSELIYAQLRPHAGLCSFHRRILDSGTDEDVVK